MHQPTSPPNGNGVRLTTSKTLQRRVIWCNQLALLLGLLALLFYGSVEAVVQGNPSKAAMFGGTFVVIQSSVLVFNKFGYFNVSRYILILETTAAITAQKLMNGSETTTVELMAPVN